MTVKKVARPEGVTVTLCMIVKDEEKCIERCLESMLPYIDRYDITDTGSSDNTKQVIKDFFDKHGVPGEVYEMTWLGFGKSRTQSLRNCDGKATYAWVIDADDFVCGNFQYPPTMDMDAYSLRIKRGDFSWFRNQIFKCDGSWEYVGVLHEYADAPSKRDKLRVARLLNEGYHVDARTEGHRNQISTPVEKYTKDALVLVDALTNPESPNYDPDNHRYRFYLGQSWFDAHEYEKSLAAYLDRVEKGGWEEEVYYSLYRIAICKTILKHPEMEVAKAYIDAWAYRPNRAEALCQLSRLYRLNGKPRHAYIYASMAAKIPFPKGDILFIEEDVYNWKALDELAATAFYAFRFDEGLWAVEKIITSGHLPESERERIISNRNHYLAKIAEINAQIPKAIEKDKRETKTLQPSKTNVKYKSRKRQSR